MATHLPGHLLSIGMLLLVSAGACGQNYPAKPIRILAAEPGASNDLVARVISQRVAASLHQQVIVENRGGASGAIAAEIVAKAAPDGYMVLFYANNIWLLPFLRDNLPYDPIRDFAPVTLAVTSPNILIVHPSLPVVSVKELIALAKRNPGALNYASIGAGGPPHLAAELFKAMAGVNIVSIPYKATPTALADLMTGQLQIMFPTAASVSPHLKSGRVKALAVTSAKASALVPELPTLASSGLPGYEAGAIFGMLAPSKTPITIVDLLNRETVRALRSAEAQEILAKAGVEVVGSSPAEFGAAIKADMARMGKVIKDAGIRAD